LLGSTAAEGLPRIGRTSIETRWRSCGLPQSASCSENFVILPDVFGQTLKKDIVVILDVGHTDKDSGQISARGIKEYYLNMKLAQRVLEELVNTGFISTQMIVT
jgi:N-acetylmuramoyl-L-alanine amidase